MDWWIKVGSLATKSKAEELIKKMAELKMNPIVMNVSNLIISRTILDRIAIPAYLKYAIDVDSLILALKLHNERIFDTYRKHIELDKFALLFSFTDDDISECIEKLSELYNLSEISELDELYVIARDLVFLYYLQLIDLSDLCSLDILTLNKIYHHIADLYTSSNDVIF